MKVGIQKEPIKNPIAKVFSLGLSSGLGLGYIPWASGTFGSLLGIPLGLILLQVNPWIAFGVLALLVVVSAPIVERSCKHWGVMDSSKVVWDEVIGMAITLLGLRRQLQTSSNFWECSITGNSYPIPEWSYIVVAFLVFRILDIFKPFPAKSLDRSATGMGVILDDVVAGLYGALIMWGLTRMAWPI